MIPKIVHYCWFGHNEKNDVIKRCIDSWKKKLPDYQIVEWNESNFDINCCQYVKEAYKAKKWAFVSDYVRTYVLLKYGGVYLDTDVEIIKSLDEFLVYKCVLGFEEKKNISTAVIMAEKNNHIIMELYDKYRGLSLYDDIGEINYETITTKLSGICKENGLIVNNQYQQYSDFCVFPDDFFSPKSFMDGKIRQTKNTVAIHHYLGSWFSDEIKQNVELSKKKPIMQKIIAYKTEFIEQKNKYGLRHGITYILKRVSNSARSRSNTIDKNLRRELAKRIIEFKHKTNNSDVNISKIDLYHSEIEQVWPKKQIFKKSTFIHDIFSNQNKLDLTIIIPLFNAEIYLSRILDMLKNQITEYKYEIILINDGSVDKTANHIDALKDFKDLVIIDQINCGISVARNHGISLSRGRFLSFIDQDDIISPMFVERCLSTAYGQNADVVKGAYKEEFYGSTCKIRWNKDICFSGTDLIVNDFPGFIWGGIFDRNLFNNIRFPENYWYEDMVVGKLIVRKAQKIVNIHDVLYTKTYHKQNSAAIVWSDQCNKCLEQLYLVEEIIRINSEINLDEDVVFFRSILYDLCYIFVKRTLGLNRHTLFQCFEIIRYICMTLYKKEYEQYLTSEELLYLYAITTNSFWCWQNLNS